MNTLSERLRDRYFRPEDHPYNFFSAQVRRRLPRGGVLLDAGCGREAPMLAPFRDVAGQLIGVDVLDEIVPVAGLELYSRSLEDTGLPASSVDVIMSRSVVEHLQKPREVFEEFRRVLKPGGRAIVLTANLWDYASIISMIVPNRLHPYIVARTEGREEHDVFPVAYRCNTRRAVHRIAREAGLAVEEFRYLGQHPSYFMFNGALYFLATCYEKTISRFTPLHWLRGWLYFVLTKPLEDGRPPTDSPSEDGSRSLASHSAAPPVA
jgi:SAM-dependent methyltransferase